MCIVYEPRCHQVQCAQQTAHGIKLVGVHKFLVFCFLVYEDIWIIYAKYQIKTELLKLYYNRGLPQDRVHD